MLVVVLALAAALTGQTAEADRLIQEGVELRTRGEDQAALGKFDRAYQIGHSMRALAQLGLVEVALGHWLDAEAHLDQVLSNAASDEWVVARAQVLDDALKKARAQLGELVLVVQVAGAKVRVNGMDVGRTPLTRPLRLPAGNAQIEVSAEGYLDAKKSVVVQSGARVEEKVTLAPKSFSAGPSGPTGELPPLPPPPAPPPPPESSSSKSLGPYFWISTIGAGVGLIVGIVGIVAAVSSDDSDPGTIVAVVGGGVGVALSITSIIFWVTGESVPSGPPAPPAAPY